MSEPAEWTLDLPGEVEPVPVEVPAEPRTRRQFAEPADETPPPSMVRLLEALLFVGGPALTADRAGEVLRGLTPDHYRELIDELNRAYRRQGRPYRIVPVEGGHAMLLQARFREVLQRLQGTVREARLTPPALDTLAIIAYREPISPSDVDAVRGADSSAPLRQLVRLGLIALERQPGEPPTVAYRTTGKFLDLFGLQSREDLPRTQDPQQL